MADIKTFQTTSKAYDLNTNATTPDRLRAMEARLDLERILKNQVGVAVDATEEALRNRGKPGNSQEQKETFKIDAKIQNKMMQEIGNTKTLIDEAIKNTTDPEKKKVLQEKFDKTFGPESTYKKLLMTRVEIGDKKSFTNAELNSLAAAIKGARDLRKEAGVTNTSDITQYLTRDDHEALFNQIFSLKRNFLPADKSADSALQRDIRNIVEDEENSKVLDTMIEVYGQGKKIMLSPDNEIKLMKMRFGIQKLIDEANVKTTNRGAPQVA